MSQEAGDTSSSGTAADAPAQKSSQQSTPAASTSAPSTSAPEKSDSSAAAAPKEDSAASAASQALKASEAVEKGGLISGKFQISFTESYTHLQTNQLYIQGFGILPIVVVGNIEVQNVRRDIFSTVIAASYKLTNRMQVSLSVPGSASSAT